MNINEEELLYYTISQALDEDLDVAGDITSAALFSAEDTASAVLRSKAGGVLSGCKLVAPIFSQCDSRIQIHMEMHDGDILQPGSVIGMIEGPVIGILAAERVCLNFLQRLSGIATSTSKYVAAISHTNARLLDTRKTVPGLRYFEKEAVRHGKGYNHRFGLYDMILIKDTHVQRAGGVTAALQKAFLYRNQRPKSDLKIEIEVQSTDQFTDALTFSPDRIMLDNMSLDEMTFCVATRDRKKCVCEIEASGNVTLSTIASVAETGVDFISVGALTHSAPALDIHLVIT